MRSSFCRERYKRLDSGLEPKVDCVGLAAAYAPQEVLGAVDNGLAPYLDAVFKSCDVHAGRCQSSILGTHIPSEEQLAVVVETGSLTIVLEHFVVAGNGVGIVVDELTQARVVCGIVVEFRGSSKFLYNLLDIRFLSALELAEILMSQYSILVSVDYNRV